MLQDVCHPSPRGRLHCRTGRNNKMRVRRLRQQWQSCVSVQQWCQCRFNLSLSSIPAFFVVVFSPVSNSISYRFLFQRLLGAFLHSETVEWQFHQIAILFPLVIIKESFNRISGRSYLGELQIHENTSTLYIRLQITIYVIVSIFSYLATNDCIFNLKEYVILLKGQKIYIYINLCRNLVSIILLICKALLMWKCFSWYAVKVCSFDNKSKLANVLKSFLN